MSELNLEKTMKLVFEKNKRITELEEENKKLNIIIENTKKEQETDRKHIEQLEEENKKLKEENEYRKGIADVLPEWEWHIAEETIQDLQKEIKKLKEELSKLKEKYWDIDY